MQTPKLLDLYKPEWFIDFAKGYYARVFRATDAVRGGEVAFKVLRPEHTHKSKEGREYQAFGLEVRLLHHFHNNPTVVKLLDCGFISDKQELPTRGEVVSLGLDVDAFNAQIEGFRARGWRPYLCETLLPEPQNLFIRLRENARNGNRRRLPTEEGIALALQYTDLLKQAHADDIVYLDVKLEHFYWDGKNLRVIDWNSSRMLRDPGDQDEGNYTLHKKNDIRNFAIGILYPIFTGIAPLGEFKEMPSNRDTAEMRYHAVKALDFGMEPSLASSLVALIHKAAAGEYADLRQFRNALELVAGEHGWPVGNQQGTSLKAKRARDAMREGLDAIRTAQEGFKLARQKLQTAMEEDCSSIDGEAERLLKQIDQLMEYRVIP